MVTAAKREPPVGTAGSVMRTMVGQARAIIAGMKKLGGRGQRSVDRTAARRLFEAERLFEDFRELTPYPFHPLARSFASFEAYERWKRAQTNPWYR